MAHLRSDVSEIKTDVRSLRDRMGAKFDALTADLASVRESILAIKVWGLGLALTIAAGVFGTMARTFGWI